MSLIAEFALLESVKKYFGNINYSKMDTKEKAFHGDAVIRNHMMWSMGAGFIPVPFVDFVAVTAIQLDMIRQLSRVYEIEFKEAQGKAFITSLSSSGIARIGAESVKFIPGVGSVLGGVTMSVLSGASTYAIGEVFKKHFETGGTFLDFDPARLKKMYKEKFEKGKKMAKKMRKEQKEKKGEEASDFTEDGQVDYAKQLKKLSKLKKKGVISEEEFEKLKDKIINA
jgi:uncharacterized protein (DUF697 family)